MECDEQLSLEYASVAQWVEQGTDTEICGDVN